jgi:hypothetical protein
MDLHDMHVYEPAKVHGLRHNAQPFQCHHSAAADWMDFVANGKPHCRTRFFARAEVATTSRSHRTRCSRWKGQREAASLPSMALNDRT